MKRLRDVSADGDVGAYAVLYAVLLVVLLGIAALVMDVAGVRADRRIAKAAADAGAIAGAAGLGVGTPDGELACRRAVGFAAASLGETVDASDCAAYASATCRSPTVIKSFATGTADWTILYRWPVADDSELILFPSVERAGTIVEQEPSLSDGIPCSRVGVNVYRDGVLALGSGLGVGASRVLREQNSVAIAAISGDPGTVVAPLVVLDEFSCDALVSTGNGGVRVLANGVKPALIVVDSAGSLTAGDIGCNGGATTIRVTNNSRIWAEDAAVDKARIQSYAMTANPLLGTAFEPSQTSGVCQPTPGTFNAPLCPTPTPAGQRVGTAPWVTRYNCMLGCPAGSDYVQQLKAHVATGPVMPVPPVRACSRVLASYTGSTFLRCTTGSETITIPANTTTVISGAPTDTLRIEAKKLDIKGTLIIRGLRVVLKVEDVSVGGGCLAFNPPAAETAIVTCTPVVPPVGYPLGPDMPPVYIQGKVNVAAGGSFVSNQTFILLLGELGISTSTAGRVYWSAPYGRQAVPPSTCTPASSSSQSPSVGCFEDLALWSDYSSGSILSGQAAVYVDGTFFLPDVPFTFNGGSGQDQTRAQFVAKRLSLTGGSTLKLFPDPERATPVPPVVGSLIR